MGQQLATEKGLAFVEAHATTFNDARQPFETLAKLFQQDYATHVRGFETTLMGR